MHSLNQRDLEERLFEEQRQHKIKFGVLLLLHFLLVCLLLLDILVFPLF